MLVLDIKTEKFISILLVQEISLAPAFLEMGKKDDKERKIVEACGCQSNGTVSDLFRFDSDSQY